MKPCILYVNDYSLKYKRTNDSTIMIRVPTRLDGAKPKYIFFNVDTTIKKINDTLRNKLVEYGWKDAAIESLEKYVLFPEDDIWRTLLRISPKHGKLLNVSNGTVFYPKKNVWKNF